MNTATIHIKNIIALSMKDEVAARTDLGGHSFYHD